MHQVIFKKEIFVILICLSLFSCGQETQTLDSAQGTGSSENGDSQETDNTNTGQTTSEVIDGQVSDLTISNGEAKVALDTLTSADSILLILYHTNTENLTGNIAMSGAAKSSLSQKDTSVIDLNLPEDFHTQLHEDETELDPEGLAFSENSLLASELTQSQQEFDVLQNMSGKETYQKVTADLILETELFRFYVDERNLGAFQLSDLQNLAEQFTQAVTTEHQIFGEESDVDSDGKFNILFTQAVNQTGNSLQSFVSGFFDAKDLYDTKKYPHSNQQEVIYAFVPDPEGSFGTPVSYGFSFTNLYPGLLAHEFQHMINFNNHVVIGNGKPENLFLNEALSHLAEDIYTQDNTGFMTGIGPENSTRVGLYLKYISKTCFICGANLQQRGGAYLFLRYLYEQAELGNLPGAKNGTEFLENLLNTNTIGVPNIINAAFGSNPPDQAFSVLLKKFALAIYLSDTNAHPDDQSQFIGINLRALQQNHRGTVLNGPAIKDIGNFPTTEPFLGSSITFVKISGSVFANLNNTLVLNFQSDENFGGMMITPH